MIWLCHDGEISSSGIFVIVKRCGGGLGSVMCASLGVQSSSRCLLAAVLWVSAAVVCPFSMSNAEELWLWLLWTGEKDKNKTALVCVGW